MKIDPEVSVSELLDNWVNGNRSYVIAKLESDHPGLTALFIVQGTIDGCLKASDCNSVCNRLIDCRMGIVNGTR
jgi:hypothetical protein